MNFSKAQDGQSQMEEQVGQQMTQNLSLPTVKIGPGNHVMLEKQVLQQLMAILKAPRSPEQQQQVLKILETQPQLMARFLKYRQQRRRDGGFKQTQVLEKLRNRQLQILHQQKQKRFFLLQQQQQPQRTLFHMGYNNTFSNPQGAAQSIGQSQTLEQVGQQMTQNLSQSTAKIGPGNHAMLQNQAVQQLMAISKAPRSPEQQQQVLKILKTQPQLMAGFLKHRQQQQRRDGGFKQTQVLEILRNRQLQILLHQQKQRRFFLLQQQQQPQRTLFHMGYKNTFSNPQGAAQSIGQSQTLEQVAQQMTQNLSQSTAEIGPGNHALLQKQALQQLMATLKAPRSPEQRQLQLGIGIKPHPQVMAAFIKQRQLTSQNRATADETLAVQFQHMLSLENSAARRQH